jgi:UDP-glucose 4-epimerase
MNVMITGAAGFIGSQLTKKIYKKCTKLILIDNFSYGNKTNLNFSEIDLSSKVINLDIRDKNGIKNLIINNQIEYIYNFAGIAPLPDCQSNPQEAIDVNVSGFVNILENSRLYGVKKVIQASTNAIYENEIILPTKEIITSTPTLIYPNTKFSAELFAKSYYDTYNLSIACLRFSNVYGPNIDFHRKQPPFMAYMIRELFYKRQPVFYSNGEQRRDYIYVDDLIDLALMMTNIDGFDILNVSSNTNYSVNELYEITQELMGTCIKAKFVDDKFYWDKYPDLFLGKHPISPAILKNEINKLTQCDNSYAKNKFSWEPKVTIREGIARLITDECNLLSKL